MDESLFSWFNNIWETEVEGSITFKVLEGSISNNYKPNFWRKLKLRDDVCINTAVSGNNLKGKTKSSQSDFPNLAGNKTDPITKPVNMKVNENLND